MLAFLLILLHSKAYYFVHSLQCVQEAVNKHLTKLANSDPSLRVGLVTFADDVSFHTCL